MNRKTQWKNPVLMRLIAIWVFIKRWDDVIGIIIVTLIAFLVAFLMMGESVYGTDPFITGKTFFCIVGIEIFITAIAYFNRRGLK